MKELLADSKNFLLVKDRLQRGFVNSARDHPYRHVMHAKSYEMEQPRWDTRSFLEELNSKEMNRDTLKRFIPQLLSRMHVECLVHGNLYQK